MFIGWLLFLVLDDFLFCVKIKDYLKEEGDLELIEYEVMVKVKYLDEED